MKGQGSAKQTSKQKVSGGKKAAGKNEKGLLPDLKVQKEISAAKPLNAGQKV